MGRKYPYKILLIMTLFLKGCSEPSEEKKSIVRPVKVFHISGAKNITQRSFPGFVEAAQKADLSFQITGQLIELLVKEGDKVCVCLSCMKIR